MDFEAQLIANRLSHQRRDIDARDAPAQFRHAAQIAAAAASEVERRPVPFQARRPRGSGQGRPNNRLQNREGSRIWRGPRGAWGR